MKKTVKILFRVLLSILGLALVPDNTQAFFLLEKVGEIKRSGAMEY